MHLKYESFVREPLVNGEKTYHQVTEDIVRPIEQKPGRMWYVGFFFSVALLAFGVFSVFWEVYFGIGVWGINRTVGWGWDITNFVW
ncbi:MAG: hydrogenase, partial [Chitinophagaceae bacterium]|nr:hydrogenase [Chitinophagaceae bacterium]